MPDLTLIDHLLKNCETASFADGIALQSNSKKLTYRELKQSIERVGAYLNGLGVEAGDRVVLVIDNSIEYVIAFYAVWRIGGIVVALNSQSKDHEINKIVNQCTAKCLILGKVLTESIELYKSLDIVLIGIDSSSIDGVEDFSNALQCKKYISHFKLEVSASAQIIYTSGTTGDPKGVLLSHGNLMFNTFDIVDYLNLTNRDSVLNVLPFHYSYGNSVLHTHIFSGAKIILAGSMAFPQDVVNKIREFSVTGFYGVPSTYSLLLSRSDWSKTTLSLRYITQAGGPMNKTLACKLIDSIGADTQLYIMYGQTEATARISWLPPELLNEKIGSVGVALNHVNIEIRNEQGQCVNQYQKGSVFVSGKNVMQGYWKNAHATQQVIFDRWLKTGDIGYMDEDGFLYLEGRKNDMIKVGAHRINPLELEEVINKLEFIEESAVVGVDDELLGQSLRAFVVGEESKNNTFSLKKHCREFLPVHKIPREIKWVNYLPKTSSGKIKRFQLL